MLNRAYNPLTYIRKRARLSHRQVMYHAATLEHQYKTPEAACGLGLAKQQIGHSMESLSRLARRCYQIAVSIQPRLRALLFGPLHHDTREKVGFRLDTPEWRCNGD